MAGRTKSKAAKPAAKKNKTISPEQAKPAAAKKATFTVRGKTFATKEEAQAYKNLIKNQTKKPCEIVQGTRKPSHRVVSFTAKSK